MRRRSVLVGAIIALCSLGLASLARAQFGPQTTEEAVRHGAEVFAATCTGYCHGMNGEAGGAPRLVGRGFDVEYINRVVTYGITGTQMPAWGAKLPVGDLASVIAYVENLNGLIALAKRSPMELNEEAKHGESIFFDQEGELNRCSDCHQIGGKGVPVAPPIRQMPGDVAGLRNLKTPHVFTATVRGETFPAIVLAQTREKTKLYNLATMPPVLRIEIPSAVKLTDGSSWQHFTSWRSSYSDDDLSAVLEYLRATVRP